MLNFSQNYNYFLILKNFFDTFHPAIVIAGLTRNPLIVHPVFQGIPRQARDDKLLKRHCEGGSPKQSMTSPPAPLHKERGAGLLHSVRNDGIY